VPVRIDLWGDEVDRLTEFSVADQRTTVDVAEVEIFPCRELLPEGEVRARAAKLVDREPWGRDVWERLAEGQFFDGMESWLPWLVGEDVLLAHPPQPDPPRRVHLAVDDGAGLHLELEAGECHRTRQQAAGHERRSPRGPAGRGALLGEQAVVEVGAQGDGERTPWIRASGAVDTDSLTPFDVAP
jgi:hypothetical protein